MNWNQALFVARARPWAIPILILLIATLVLSWNSYNYYPFIADDTFISLRYAQRLLDGRGLTWTDGERVEGYSNLSWVLGCALLGRLGMDLVVAARVLGWACSAATLSAIVYLAIRRRSASSELTATAIATLALATSGIVAVWAIGGLEQPLAAALVAWAHVLVMRWIDQDFSWSRHQGQVVGVLLGLLCWTRPDGPMFTVTLLGALIAGSGFNRNVARRSRTVVLIALSFYLSQLVFRRVYYGEWVANTALVKLSWTATRREEGWKYLSDGLAGLTPILLLTLPLILRIWDNIRACKRVLLLVTSSIAWCAYVVVIGGDIFPAHRHLVPLMPLLALLVVESGRVVLKWSPVARRGWQTVAFFCLVAFAWRQWRDPDNQIAQGERWEWDAVATGRLLREEFGPAGALLAADVAGSLVYFSKLPAIDMLGLNDRYLAKHPPKDFGTKRLAHELGNGEYILNRQPDLVIFNAPTGDIGGVWRSGIEMGKSVRFHQGYRHVLFETDDPHGLRTHVFVRLEGRAGIRRDSMTTIPGFLWGDPAAATARIDTLGRLGVVLRANTASTLRGVSLPNVPQSISVHATGEPVTITITCGNQSRSSTGASLSTWACGDPQGFAIGLRSRGVGLSHVRDVQFAR